MIHCYEKSRIKNGEIVYQKFYTPNKQFAFVRQRSINGLQIIKDKIEL